MHDGASAADLLRGRTRLVPAPFVPEVLLHVGSGVVELWEGVEAHVGRSGLEPPFWAFPWAGGQALARYVLDHPHVVAGRRVLDVASGSGLVALAAARAGAASVLADDVDPLALQAVRANAAANGLAVAVTGEDLLDGDGGGADVVLVGDACYARALALRVTAFCERAAARGAAVLLGDPGRAHLPRERLRRVATYDVPVLAELEDREVKRTAVWTVAPAAAGTP
ncbi:Predicted nicotinamide N-methyase [Quadrisphaera sp. DSM 44207]|nr:50S ribosomal protein L11 methyltransferase [Quadrisphaera sp. DSM 44207]SDQ04016.1 Predicted nicotinamide N-methyase [Quadrisphaera sp. DSM 44207]